MIESGSVSLTLNTCKIWLLIFTLGTIIYICYDGGHHYPMDIAG